MKKPSVSVIIPIYNEERTVSAVVKVVSSWRGKDEVIVVNDGSTDASASIVASFKSKICVITHKKNKGKGFALASGIRQSRGEILMFLDGDIVGLTHRDLDALVGPVITGQAEMALGAVRFWRLKLLGPAKAITGERVVRRINVIPHLSSMKNTGYGVEMLLNRIHKNLRVVTVKLPTVYIIDKLNKQSFPSAFGSYLKEWKEVAQQTVCGWRDSYLIN